MRLSLGFIIRESVDGLRRGVFHSYITIAAMIIAVTMAGIFIYSIYNLHKAAEGLLSSLQVQAFISMSVPEQNHTKLAERVQQFDPRWTVEYITRDEAAAEFAQEFDPELFNILKVNPLPASLRINLPAEMMQPDSISKVIDRISAVSGIDDVIYDHELLVLLHAGMNKLTIWGGIIAAITIFIAIGITFNAIRLKIHAQQDAMNLMSLLGASPALLHALYLCQGAILGIAGGLISAGIIIAIAGAISLRLTSDIVIALPHIYLLAIIGGILGIIGSLLAVRRYLAV